jgi:hypothetical protein
MQQRTAYAFEQGSSYDDSETVQGATTVNDDDTIDDANNDDNNNIYEQDDVSTLTAAYTNLHCTSITLNTSLTLHSHAARVSM